MHYLNTKEAAAILNCGTKNVTMMCAAGKFPGAKKVMGKKTDEWRIPAQEVIDYQANKEVEAEVLPPESHELVTVKSLADFFMDERRRNDAEHDETRRILEEEVKRRNKEIEELRGILTKQEEGIAAVWGKVMEKKKPGWIARLLGIGNINFF